jgi:hypothetical protein
MQRRAPGEPKVILDYLAYHVVRKLVAALAGFDQEPRRARLLERFQHLELRPADDRGKQPPGRRSANH